MNMPFAHGLKQQISQTSSIFLLIHKPMNATVMYMLSAALFFFYVNASYLYMLYLHKNKITVQINNKNHYLSLYLLVHCDQKSISGRKRVFSICVFTLLFAIINQIIKITKILSIFYILVVYLC